MNLSQDVIGSSLLDGFYLSLLFILRLHFSFLFYIFQKFSLLLCWKVLLHFLFNLWRKVLFPLCWHIIYGLCLGIFCICVGLLIVLALLGRFVTKFRFLVIFILYCWKVELIWDGNHITTFLGVLGSLDEYRRWLWWCRWWWCRPWIIVDDDDGDGAYDADDFLPGPLASQCQSTF